MIEAELYPTESRELMGILPGAKRSEEGFSQDDQLTLTTLANQVAVTIENARHTPRSSIVAELDTL